MPWRRHGGQHGAMVNGVCGNKENLCRELWGECLLGKGAGTLREKRWDWTDVPWIRSGCSRALSGWAQSRETEELDHVGGPAGQLGMAFARLAVPEGLQHGSPDISSPLAQNVLLGGRDNAE